VSEPPNARDTARARVAELVRAFRRNEADYLSSTYNETQARTDFITPLLEAFGWDVHNRAGHPLGFREVIEEATVEVGPERLSKRPDYELRLARQRKLFVEAKKPSISLDRNREAAFQTRRYGYSASIPISILTNFHELAIYDCQPVPSISDEAQVARRLLVRYDELETRFEELWPLLSRQSIYSGEFDRIFEISGTRHGAEQFDDLFLRQVKSWRERLARDIHSNAPSLSPSQLTYAVQLFLSRIVFLRICEDREIERYETLKNLPEGATFDALMAELRRADEFYDSGLFRLIEDGRLGIRITDSVLHSIITELYYPQSPYTFAVVETEVLGEIYEQFLGEEIAINGRRVEIIDKPEVRESGGVFATPRYIVDAIVARTVLPLIVDKSPAALANFTAADICCGSGIFLLSIYELILEHYLAWYVANDPEVHAGRAIYESGGGQWRLTLSEKRRILLAHVRGVDIDPNAVEVARFSLLLKLIEGEDAASLHEFVRTHRTPALPSLDEALKSGNSLVSPDEWSASMGAMSAALMSRINPFDWGAEFPREAARGGFDVIVCNPPYVRIQNMATYSAEEVAFYQNARSPYTTAHQDNFDKYALFIERSLRLLAASGRLGVIAPHKFTTTQAGRALRGLIASPRLLEQMIHFGVKQVFGRRASNYTCIMVLDRRGVESVLIEQVGTLEEWRYRKPGKVTRIPAASLGEDTWQFASAPARELFDRVRGTHTARLNSVAEIFVGVQTSADAIYIFKSVAENTRTVITHLDGRDWKIERGVLRPCLLDVSLEPYSRPQPNAWMIFPYRIVATARGERAELIPKEEMEKRYPGCFAYLTAHRKALSKRNVIGGAAAGREFYQFGRSQSLTKFNTPKIILPILSVEARYAYDDSNIVVTGGGNGPYYMVRALAGQGVSDLYLIGVLNHPLSEAIIRTNTSPFRGGYYSHGKQFIENLPIPIPTEKQRFIIEEAVRELLDANTALAGARTPHETTLHARTSKTLRARIQSMVSALFALTAEDMETVLAVPVPT
jgi:type I restriction-modification system DNA methylase subunit